MGKSKVSDCAHLRERGVTQPESLLVAGGGCLDFRALRLRGSGWRDRFARPHGERNHRFFLLLFGQVFDERAIRFLHLGFTIGLSSSRAVAAFRGGPFLHGLENATAFKACLLDVVKTLSRQSSVHSRQSPGGASGALRFISRAA